MLQRKPKPLPAGKLLEYALRSLSSRAHSLGELRQKLHRRAEKPEDIEEVISKLKDAGYLDDQRFAEGFASARLQNEGLGKQRVLRDLRTRRVAPGLAEQVVEQTFRETNETELVEAYLARKFRGKSLPEFLSDEKNLAGAFRRLRYAGFGAGTAITVLKRYANSAEKLEDQVIEELDVPDPDLQ